MNRITSLALGAAMSLTLNAAHADSIQRVSPPGSNFPIS